MSTMEEPPARPAEIVMSTFMYPWDLADVGVEDGLSRLADEGFGAFELTACYHPILTHTPGAGRRLMQMEHGAVMVPTGGNYGLIRPSPHPDPELMTVWPRAAEAAADLDLELNAWTVSLYQPWIAEAYPETARVTPEGQINKVGVCPSSPHVREFLAHLVEDMVTRFPIRTVQLEGVTHPFIDTGWRLPRTLLEMSEWSRWLASLCFCESCKTSARARGVDVIGLRSRIVDELRRAYEEGVSDPRPWREASSERRTTDLDYDAFLSMRDDNCVDLVRSIATAVDRGQSRTQLGIWGPLEFDGTQLPFERVSDVVDLLQTRQPLVAPENARRARELADRHGMRVSTVQWCGGRIGPPWGPDFEKAFEATVALGADQVNLFNWAMLPPYLSRQIVPLMRSVEAR